jgi:hypothetical protein
MASHLGFSPRPAHVSPFGPLYFGATFLLVPLRLLLLLSGSALLAVEAPPISWSSSFRRLSARLLSSSAISSRSLHRASLERVLSEVFGGMGPPRSMAYNLVTLTFLLQTLMPPRLRILQIVNGGFAIKAGTCTTPKVCQAVRIYQRTMSSTARRICTSASGADSSASASAASATAGSGSCRRHSGRHRGGRHSRRRVDRPTWRCGCRRDRRRGDRSSHRPASRAAARIFICGRALAITDIHAVNTPLSILATATERRRLRRHHFSQWSRRPNVAGC